LRSAGGIVLAKTAILGSEGSPDVRNPHDTTRSPGGSSSGEAVAVAAGASPLGLGSDSGGSIRLPAAWCGVAGLKPSAGRVPNTGHFPRIGERSDGRTQIGPLASTVADLALALELIAGPDGRDPSVALVALGDPSSVDLSGLRVSSFISEPGWEPEDAIASAVEDATRALVSRGARPVDPPPRHLDESLDITRRYWRRRELSGEEAARQLWDWDRFRRRMTMWAEAIDVLVMPATPMRAPVMRPTEEEDYAFTLPASLTGWPAVTVPVGVADGLPVAVQIVATAWNDHIALAAAAAIEESVST
jgi:amidase